MKDILLWILTVLSVMILLLQINHGTAIEDLEIQQTLQAEQDSTYRWFIHGDAVFFQQQNGEQVVDSIYKSRVMPNIDFFARNGYNISSGLYQTMFNKVRVLNVNDIMTAEGKDTIKLSDGIYYRRNGQINFKPLEQ